jgi:hypothetical protein
MFGSNCLQLGLIKLCPANVAIPKALDGNEHTSCEDEFQSASVKKAHGERPQGNRVRVTNEAPSGNFPVEVALIVGIQLKTGSS